MIIVVVSPHRDDAAFSLGLSIDAWLAAGHTVSVLNCFTQSAYAPFSDVQALHPNDRTSFATAVRRREDVAWSKLLGSRFSFHDLDLLDAPLRLGCSADEVLTVEIRAGDRAVTRVEGALAKLARSVNAREVAIAAPLAVGGHIDHRVVHQAALGTLPNTQVRLAFYEDLPYAAREGEADRLPSIAESTLPGLRPVFASPPASDIASLTARKTRIAECYDSQVDSETVRSIAHFAASYQGRERLWADAAWCDSALVPAEEAAA